MTAQPTQQTSQPRAADLGADRSDEKTVARLFAMILGAVFLAVGILGFIRPLTDAGGDGLFVAGDAHLLGIFHVNWLHNLVHLGTGLLGIVMAARTPSARLFAQALGVIYTVVFVAGLFTGDLFGILPLNGADNVLHLLTAAASLLIGFTPVGLRVLGGEARRATA